MPRKQQATKKRPSSGESSSEDDSRCVSIPKREHAPNYPSTSSKIMEISPPRGVSIDGISILKSSQVESLVNSTPVGPRKGFDMISPDVSVILDDEPAEMSSLDERSNETPIGKGLDLRYRVVKHEDLDVDRAENNVELEDRDDAMEKDSRTSEEEEIEERLNESVHGFLEDEIVENIKVEEVTNSDEDRHESFREVDENLDSAEAVGDVMSSDEDHVEDDTANSKRPVKFFFKGNARGLLYAADVAKMAPVMEEIVNNSALKEKDGGLVLIFPDFEFDDMQPLVRTIQSQEESWGPGFEHCTPDSDAFKDHPDLYRALIGERDNLDATTDGNGVSWNVVLGNSAEEAVQESTWSGGDGVCHQNIADLRMSGLDFEPPNHMELSAALRFYTDFEADILRLPNRGETPGTANLFNSVIVAHHEGYEPGVEVESVSVGRALVGNSLMTRDTSRQEEPGSSGQVCFKIPLPPKTASSRFGSGPVDRFEALVANAGPSNAPKDSGTREIFVDGMGSPESPLVVGKKLFLLECHYCKSKPFSSKSSLRKHVKSVHPGKPLPPTKQEIREQRKLRLVQERERLEGKNSLDVISPPSTVIEASPSDISLHSSIIPGNGPESSKTQRSSQAKRLDDVIAVLTKDRKIKEGDLTIEPVVNPDSIQRTPNVALEDQTLLSVDKLSQHPILASDGDLAHNSGSDTDPSKDFKSRKISKKKRKKEKDRKEKEEYRDSKKKKKKEKHRDDNFPGTSSSPIDIICPTPSKSDQVEDVKCSDELPNLKKP